MKIEIISGLDEKVFALIGPFAMNPKRIAENGNPITTSRQHKWYVVRGNEDDLIGFCSVKFADSSKNMQIGNLFILQGGKKTFNYLIKRIIKDTAKDKGLGLRAYANNETINDYIKLGFEVIQPGVNWHILKFTNDGLRRCTKED